MISDMNQAAESLQGLQRLALMIDSVSDAIVTIGSRGIIEYANRGAEELFGYRLEELLGRNVSMLMPAPDSNRHDAYIFAYLKTGQSRVMNHRRSVNGLRKDGSLVPLDLTLGQMLENGEQKFTAVMRDVTEQRRLQQLAAEAERALQHAKDRADDANKAKSIFLATMSHEIRTPMNGVLGSLELLALTELTDSQHETVAMAEQSGRELLRLLDDILDFSKIEAGRLELRHERTAMREHILDKIAATYSPLAMKKGIALRTKVDPAVAQRFCTDPLRLRQILHNFVSNAIKFTLAGSIELSLDVVHTDPDAQLLKFTVRDTGIGISAANQAKLFQAFVQADGDTTRRFGGTGLGLAICLGLAASMGGTIGMESAPGLGTTMTLELRLPVLQEIPAEDGRDKAPAAARVSSAPERGISRRQANAALSDALVLVVDDHATNRNVLVRQLASLGYRAESATNGVDALAKLDTRKYSVLISDCQMPEMDGYTLARTIREQESRLGLPRLPIIAFTANAFASDAARAIDAGMDDYLAKPTTISSLSALLARYLPFAPAPASNAPQTRPTSQENAAFMLDEVHLAAIVGNDSSARRAFLEDFKASCDSDARLLEVAYQSGDLCTLMEVAHRICGASKMVGATSLATACLTIELSGRERLAGSECGGQADTLGASTRAAYTDFQHQFNAFNNFLVQRTTCLNNASSQ